MSNFITEENLAKIAIKKKSRQRVQKLKFKQGCVPEQWNRVPNLS